MPPSASSPAPNPATLLALVERFAHPRIMLIGDMMVDEYIYGNAERLSPEAPVPVVQESYRERRAGGAGNVAADLATLGAQVLCVSIRGSDPAGELLVSLLQKSGADPSGVLIVPDRPTTSKVRLVGLAQHRHPQQMLRLDHEDTRPIGPDQESRLLDYVRANLPSCDLLCLEDYNKGLLTKTLCQQVISIARGLKKPILVDPAAVSDYSRYKGVTTITPNRTEAEKATGLLLQDAPDAAPQLAAALLDQLDLEACVLTLDRHGMYLLERNKPGQLHTTRARTVYDVTGAGDMVLACMAMARACGASWADAVDLANIAGGLEVEKFGCVPIKKEEILHELLSLESDAHGKTPPLAALLVELERHRKAGRKIVFTNGCFDILHAGHVAYLQFARRQGDLLVLGLNTDESVRRQGKSADRPINPLADRMAVLAALAAVDYIVPFDEDTPAKLIEAVQPDVLVKGEDYAGKEVVGRETVEGRGGKVVLAPYLQGRSTTGIIERMKK